MTSRRADALTVVLLAAAAAAVLTALGRLPALTSDEAWVGLFAIRLRGQGLVTPHEMNTYTGPLYGLILSKVFAWRGVSVSSLRLLGACANVSAFVLLIADIRKRTSSQAAAWSAAVLAGSAYLLLKSRLAWDVYALQPFLLAVTFSLLDGPVTFPRALLFCAASLIGAQNHFIYLSLNASLAAMYAARVAWRDEESARPWLRVSLAALGAGAVVFLVKPRLTDAAWASERLWAVPLFLLLAPLAAAARDGDWERPFVDALRRREARTWGARVFALGVAAFVVWHGAPLWSALSGPVVWERVIAWPAPWWLAAPLGAWGALLIGLLAWRAVRAWHGREGLNSHERTLALWPAFYAACFILFRNTSSLRYYSPIQFLSLAALGPALARMPRADRRWAGALAAVSVISTQFLFWRELAAPQDRPPRAFHIGWHRENSRDFARKDALFAAFDASGACRAAHQERSFVAIPLDFHRAETGPVPCDPSKEFDAEETVPYRWTVVSAPR
jgi:hypothetical protein